MKQEGVWAKAQRSTVASYSVRGRSSQRAERTEQDKACVRSCMLIAQLVVGLTTKGAIRSLWRKKVQHKACVTKESKSSNKDPTIPLPPCLL